MAPTEVIEPTDTVVEPTDTAGPVAEPAAEELLSDDLLVEEISIDGMCGVY